MGILKHRRVFFNFTFRMQHRHSKTLAFNEYAESEEVPKAFIYSSHPQDSRW